MNGILSDMGKEETVVILAGGKGTRLAEETIDKPKPMVQILGVPIILRIMEHYAAFGFTNFVICAGYKSEVLKEFFWNYRVYSSDLEIDLKNGRVDLLRSSAPDWQIKVIDTGLETMTGGRLKRIKEHVGETFLMTYGDGLSDVDLTKVLEFHAKHGRLATLTSVLEPTRFAILDIDDKMFVKNFREKPEELRRRINGGFFVLNKKVLDLIEGDSTVFEEGPLKALAARGELAAYDHGGFWHAVDSVRDKENLEQVLLSRSQRSPSITD